MEEGTKLNPQHRSEIRVLVQVVYLGGGGSQAAPRKNEDARQGRKGTYGDHECIGDCSGPLELKPKGNF